ncbi:MAG: CpaF family protein [DPANN group archaeon]|nr:CpaF family protein [DPANN group archaeon]
MAQQPQAAINVEIIDEKPLKKYVMEKPRYNTLLIDPSLEEIMINGPDVPVFIYHRQYGVCETNLHLSNSEIMAIIKDAERTSTDKIDITHPFLDARLPDGSRMNATIPPATPTGPTITIRKFSEEPFSIIDLILAGTLSVDLAAFLWMAVEGQRNYPLNILVIGGTGSGKTTTLNNLLAFVPVEERIITIEDVRELSLPNRPNVVRMEGSSGRAAVTMNDLLINALRMRPDRLVIGEVRSTEAQTLFSAMNVGHSAVGTVHANSPAESMARLSNYPMNVPKSALPLVDLIIVQQKIKTNVGLKRRITGVVEVSKSESELGVSFNEVYHYDIKTDDVKRTSLPSGKMQKLSERSGIGLSELKQKQQEKAEVLQSLVDDRMTTFAKVQDVIQRKNIEETTGGADLSSLDQGQDLGRLLK